MGAPSENDILIGNLAIQSQLVSPDQVRECLELLAKLVSETDLGQVLVRKGYLSEPHRRAIEQKLSQTRAAKEAVEGKIQILTAAELARIDFRPLADKAIADYLMEVRRFGASDLHFQVGSPPFARTHGQLVYLNHPVIGKEVNEARVRELLSAEERSIFDERGDIDFTLETAHGRYRANAFRHRKGVDAVFRVIPRKVPSLADLHLPDVLKKFTTYRQGIILVTGPTGSGKSSTLAALIDIINQEQRDHIVTVEDPIEIVIPSKSCNVSQRQVGVHTADFHSALRSALRADPDYIVVGEMRDLETVSMAITAAETGHLVLGTLHTTNAVRSIDRLVDIFPPGEQDQVRSMVSESLRGVVSQQLIPRADGKAREPALEIMFATSAVGNLIREKKTFQLASVLQTGTNLGMVAMDDSIADLLKRGVITRDAALFHAENPERFE